MDIEELLKKALNSKTVYTGFYASMLINTHEKTIPSYLRDFINEVIVDSGYMYGVRAFSDQTKHKNFWKKRVDESEAINDRDKLFQIVFSLNIVGLKERDFKEYMDDFMYTRVYPYLIGCDFGLAHIMYGYCPEEKYSKIGSGGSETIIIYENSLTDCLYGILNVVFNCTPKAIQEATFYFKTVGWLKLEKCMDTKNLGLFKELMDEVKIKYELEENDSRIRKKV